MIFWFSFFGLLITYFISSTIDPDNYGLFDFLILLVPSGLYLYNMFLLMTIHGKTLVFLICLFFLCMLVKFTIITTKNGIICILAFILAFITFVLTFINALCY